MENSNKDFSHLISFLSRVQTQIKDSFFASKFLIKIELLTLAYIDYKIALDGEERSVAQYNSCIEMKFALESLIDLVEYLTKLNLTSTTSLLLAQKFLLKTQIELSHQASEISLAIKEETKKLQVPTTTQKITPKDKSISATLSDSKESILNFIKNNPEVRTKEIINNFKSMSGRTVKRNLSELVKDGHIIKRGENKAVFYRSS